MILGIDTSNYTTSTAFFAETGQAMARKLLDVPPGELGLRQSTALFQHVKMLPVLLEELSTQGDFGQIAGIGVSTRPREVEGSYMPCFLPGESVARSLSATLGVPWVGVSHQQGHLVAAAWSVGRLDWLDAPFLAWHLSGGTTELLHVTPQGRNVVAQVIGGTSDISAGQLIDRVGQKLGLAFPAGKALDGLALTCDTSAKPFPIKVNRAKGLTCSLSGMENQVANRLAQGASPQEIARFTLDSLGQILTTLSREAQNIHGNLPLIFCGGVASSRQLAPVFGQLGAVCAPDYATDNALGVAVLAQRLLQVES